MKMIIQKNDPRLCIAGTEGLWSICRETRDNAGLLTETLAENVEHADAVLFAAAPELLAHLKILVNGISEGVAIPSDGAAVNAALEAIAKAERGEA